MDPEELSRALAALEDARDTLLDLQSRAWETVVGDRHLRNSLERALEVAASSMIDVCAHVLTREGHPPAETYREVFQILVQVGRLPASLGKRLEGWAGLRNLLAHRYARIDHSRIRPILVSELIDLDEFLRWAASL